MNKVDLLVKDVKIYNAYLKRFIPADVYVLGGRIYYVDAEFSRELPAEKTVDGKGFLMLPGFIDIHMHIESSMMTPASFGERAASCGVTTLVSEPHEIANVMGVQGIHEMINGSANSPIDIYYGIPSSVPSTNETLETTGGIIGFEEMKQLMREDGVVCVGEVMNYRQIIKGTQTELTRFLDYLRKEAPQAVVEGHCPSLTGLDLAKFLYRGIDSDHTEHSLEEIRQRFVNGMFVELQEKMLKPDIIQYIVENSLYEHCCFVTDDTMADALLEKGQLNYIVKRAVKLGFPLEEAVYCASYTPARRMNLRDRGTLAPGKKADFQLVKEQDVFDFWPEAVYKDGEEIFRKGQAGQKTAPYRFPEAFYHSVHLDKIEAKDLEPKVSGREKTVQVRVIEVCDGRTQTREKLVTMEVENDRLKWQDSGCMLAVVMERHGKNRNIGYGFVTGDCLKRGAAATTYYHDHHNLMVIGGNTEDMSAAAERLVELQGGICTAENGKISSQLALPIGGILSDLPADEIGRKLGDVRRSMEDLGYQHYNPIMSMCTLGLPVSPALKLTDCGLVDVIKGEIVPLIVGA